MRLIMKLFNAHELPAAGENPSGSSSEARTEAAGAERESSPPGGGPYYVPRASAEWFRAIIRHSRDGVIIIDDRGTIVEWSESEEEITGIPRWDALGRPIWDVQFRLAPAACRTPGFLRAARTKALNGLREGLNLRRSIEEDIERPDGTRRIVQSLIFAVPSNGDLFACGICRDVTDSRRTNIEVRAREERLSVELAAAGRVQRSMLPAALPDLPEYSMTAFHEPCEAVGGDLYDAALLKDGRVAMVIGDVAGKGMGAALLMSNVIACLRVLYQECLDPCCVAERLHQELLESTEPDYFVTLFFGILDPARHRLDYVNAGHNPPLLLCGDSDPLLLSATGLPLGILPGARYEAATVDLPPDSLLCLFSDGITEARMGIDYYGDERFARILRSLRSRPLEEITEGVLRDLRIFLGDTPPGDDMTLLLLRRPADSVHSAP